MTNKPKRRAHRTVPTQVNSNKGKIWTFPKNTLEEAIKIAKAIEDKNGGNPMPAQELAKAVGFNQSSDWRFLDLVRSGNLYEIVEGSGASALISITSTGRDIVAPSSP